MAKRKPPDHALKAVCDLYYEKHARHLPSRVTVRADTRRMCARLPEGLLVSELTAPMLLDYRERRRRDTKRVGMGPGKKAVRVPISPRTVNRDLEVLRTVLRWAEELHGIPHPKLPWGRLMLPISDEVERCLSIDEEERLFAALRPDHHALIRFALQTGQRMTNLIELEWRQIDFAEAAMRLQVKSKRPGGRSHVVPLTRSDLAILERERGNHPLYVFTYICTKNRNEEVGSKTIEHVLGERYPIVKFGLRKIWTNALEKAEIENFRFHDLRHTAATRLVRAGAHIKQVSGLLGHADIDSTLRYLKYDVDDLRGMRERAEEYQAALAAARKTG